MAEKRTAITTCNVCWETMNHTDRVPVGLPGCGHTFCRHCLVTINTEEGYIKCPICNHLHLGSTPEDLPVNWAVAALLEPAESNETQNRNNTSGEPPKDTREAPSPSRNTNEAPASCGPSKPDPNKSCSGSCNTQNSEPPNRGLSSKVFKGIGIAAATVACGVGAVAAAPVVLAGVGFTSAGVAAGSFAASMMSGAAIANGGGIAAGSLVAVLQSAGAAGIGASASAALGATGATAGAGIGYGFSRLFGRSSRSDDGANNVDADSPPNDDDDDDERKGLIDNDCNKKGANAEGNDKEKGMDEDDDDDKKDNEEEDDKKDNEEEDDKKEEDDDKSALKFSECTQKFSNLEIHVTKDGSLV